MECGKHSLWWTQSGTECSKDISKNRELVHHTLAPTLTYLPHWPVVAGGAEAVAHGHISCRSCCQFSSRDLLWPLLLKKKAGQIYYMLTNELQVAMTAP